MTPSIQSIQALHVRARTQVENLVEDAPLEEVQERFKFLGQLNQYHSSVEDEVSGFKGVLPVAW